MCSSSTGACSAGTRLRSPPASGWPLASVIAALASAPNVDAGDPIVERRCELRRDHRSENRDREQARDPRDGVVDSRADPGVARLDRVEHGRRQRRHRHRQADAEHEHRRQQVDQVVGVVVEAASQASPAAPRIGPIPIGSRGPIREASAPKRPESRSMITVIGVVAAPASKAL